MAEEEEKSPVKKPTGKVFDVRRPGRAPASPTSRPVIIGHKPEAQEAQVAVSGIGEARPLMTKRKIQITPESGPAVAAESEAIAVEGTSTSQSILPEKDTQTVTGPPDLPTDDSLAAKTGPKLRIEPPQTSEVKTTQTPAIVDITKPKIEPSGAENTTEPGLKPNEQPAETSSVPEEPVSSQEQAAEPQEDQAPEPHIEPLFNESGVVVSTHNHHHRHHTWHVLGLLLLIVLLAAAGLNMALDLNLLNLEGIPHTNFLN